MISDDSMSEMIRSLHSPKMQIFDEVYNWRKSKCKYQNLWQRRKLTLSIFLYQEKQVWAIVSYQYYLSGTDKDFHSLFGTPERLKY